MSKLNFIAWCTGHYEESWATKKMKELQASGQYLAVKKGYRKRENGKTYVKIYVAPEYLNETTNKNQTTTP